MACVKVALDGQPHLLGERQVAYMAFSQLWAGGLEVVDGIVRGPKQIRSDVILSEARLDDYDCVVIVGMGVSTMRAAAIYLTHRLLPHHKQGMHLLSEGAFEAAMTEAVLRSGAGQILAKLRPATEMPILLVPEPLVNAAIRKDEVWSGVWTGEFVPFLVAQYFECVRRYLGSQADLLMQPPETIADEVFRRAHQAADGVAAGQGGDPSGRDQVPGGGAAREERHEGPEGQGRRCHRARSCRRNPG